MNSEWNKFFLTEIEKLQQITLKHSKRTSEFLPRYSLSREFFDQYLTAIENSYKEKNKNPYLEFSNYQEYRLLSLLNNLNKAKLKFFLNTKERRDPISEDDYQLGMDLDMSETNCQDSRNTSQLVLVNNIIKNSFELTSYIFLLEWLQSIYFKSDPIRTKHLEMLEKTCEKINKQKGKFDPDNLNSKVSDSIDIEDSDKYNKLMEQVVINIRRGKLEEAQKLAEYYQQGLISVMLNGGLPMNDFMLDNSEAFAKVDFDLFPPFMKNKEFYEIKNNITKILEYKQKGSNINESMINDKVSGNSNWLIWFQSIYEACDYNNDDAISNPIKLMQTYLSGNPNFIENNKLPVYDVLYSHILSMLNFKIINEYSKDGNLLNVHYNEESPDFNKYFNKISKGKDIKDLIKTIQSKPIFKETLKSDFLLDFELQLIQMHFINYKENNNAYFEKLHTFLLKFIEIIEGDYLEGYVRTHFNTIDLTLQNRNGFSINENETRYESNILLMKLNYLKILFNTLISFYVSNSSIFVEGLKSKSTEITKINKQFDYLISLYFKEMSKFIIKMNFKYIPNALVFILGFCLDINTVQSNLTQLAEDLKEYDYEHFRQLVNEINLHFNGYQEDLISNIANGTHIYNLSSNILSIDDILHYQLKQQVCDISNDDKTKIQQINLLYSDRKVDNETVLKFMLKLCIKFLSNNKFLEAYELESCFKDQLNVYKFLNESFVRENKFDSDDSNFLIFLEEQKEFRKYNIEMYQIGIYFTVLLTKFTLNCFMNFKNLIKFIIDLNCPQNFNGHINNLLKEKVKEILISFKNFFRLIRILANRKEIEVILINFFGEEVYLNDIKNIVSSWIYQILKWTVDLNTEETFTRIENLVSYDGLTILMDLLNSKDESLIKNLLIENVQNDDISFLRFLDNNQEKRMEVFTFLYRLTKINRQILREVFDEDINKKLLEDIENFEF